MPMPKQLHRDAYCSAPSLSTTTLQLPRISRAQEARRPREPLIVVKREVAESSIESVEFVVDDGEGGDRPSPAQGRRCGPPHPAAAVSHVYIIERAGNSGPGPKPVGTEDSSALPYTGPEPGPSGPAPRQTQGIKVPTQNRFWLSDATRACGQA